MKWNIGMTPTEQMIAKVRNAHAMADPATVEHVTLQESYYANGKVSGLLRPYDADSLHPWERDLVTNGEPFARPSNRVRS